MLLRKDFRKDAVLAGIAMLCVVGLLLTALALDAEAHCLTEERTVTTTETVPEYGWEWIPNEEGVLEKKYVQIGYTTITKTSTYTVEIEHPPLPVPFQSLSDVATSLWNTATSIWDALTGGGDDGEDGDEGGNP